MPFEHEARFEFARLKQCNSSIGRVYSVETGPCQGHVYPSITRVLAARPKPALEAWKKRVGAAEAARVSQTATVKGSNVHKLAECFLGNEELPHVGPHVLESWNHLRVWLAEHITKVYTQEQDVFSRKLKVAGRMDLLADHDGVLSVVDVKTAKSQKREEWVEDYYLQATFYALAVYEQTGVLPGQIVIPIVSPAGMQVFHSKPAIWFPQLIERIDEFYDTYQAA